MEERKGRLYFLDNLKVALTMLVVTHHAGQPYGGSNGFWYFKSEQTTNLGPFFAVNAAFFMTLFFMISGYFLPASYDRTYIFKGSTKEDWSSFISWIFVNYITLDVYILYKFSRVSLYLLWLLFEKCFFWF